MRNGWMLLVLLTAGCSTHPIADVMDLTLPGRMFPNEVPPYGGVCGAQGSVLAPGITCPPAPAAVPATMPPLVPPGPPVVPPAVPLGGNVAPAPTPLPVAPPP